MLDFKFDEASLERALEELVQKELTPTVKGLAQEVWASILLKTPQSHGRLVASWSYSVNTPIVVDRSNMVISNEDAKAKKPPYFYRGHRTAIGIANRMNDGNATSFKLGDTIFFANGADHGEGSYSTFIEYINDTDPNWLHAFNKPGAMVRRTIQNVEAKYGASGISQDQAERLKGSQIS